MIDDRIEGPLVPLGREVSTPSGPIDNLSISKNGYLVVIETKLWGNPEARRKVVAQILDYAAHVRSWSYDDVDLLASSRASKSLWEFVSPTDIDEHEWVDHVSRNLKKGRMCLLIVGDGIREEAHGLVAALDGHPDFEFRLGLVALRVHEVPDLGRLVIPFVVAQTTEVVRAIVRIEGGEASVVTPSPPDAGTARRRPLTEEAFLDNVKQQQGPEHAAVAKKLLELISDPLVVTWGTNSFGIKVHDPAGSGKLLCLFTVLGGNETYFYPPYLTEALQDLWRTPSAVERVIDAMNRVCERFDARRTPQHQFIDLTKLTGRESQFVAVVVEVAELIKEEALRLE